MRILHIGLSSNYGGVEGFVMTYFRELRKQGIIFDFIDTYGAGLACQDEIACLGGKIFTIEDSRSHPKKAGSDISAIIMENRYKCVHIHMLSAANLIPVVSAIKCGVPTIIHSHNASTTGVVRTLLHHANRGILQKLKVTKLACSNKSGKWLYGAGYNVIANAIEVDRFSFSEYWRRSIREELKIDENTILMGFVGRLEAEKNPLFLCDVLKKMLDEKKDTVIAFLGAGKLLPEIKRKTEELGIEDRVIFTGLVNNVNEWMSAMDCILVPSHNEGLGIVCIEAQACGLPCVVSENVPEDVEITDLVSRVPLNNVNLWSETAVDMTRKKRIRERYSTEIENSAYNILRAAGQLQEIYEGLTQGNSK